MKLLEAEAVAREAAEQLRPFCSRLEIAGSIRRRKQVVGDVELVAIPKKLQDGFFDDVVVVDPAFVQTVNAWPKVKGDPLGKYTQRILPGDVTLDLFICREENWGLIYAIRTGSASFVRYGLMTGLLSNGYRARDGQVWEGNKPIPTPEEGYVFHLASVSWKRPEERL